MAIIAEIVIAEAIRPDESPFAQIPAAPAYSDEARRELLALRPEIVASALKMARDETEATQLTDLTFSRAFAAPPREGPDRVLDTRLWLFRLLRSEFHSVERQRQARRERGFTVASRQTTVTDKTS
jgi:DNA-directed RNA polymerase specialized sigma24 family protein